MLSNNHKPLPRVICLHGAGSSGAILQAQGRKIFRVLSENFQFIFLDAPFPSSPGPGMLPVFKDSGPFYRWQCDESATKNFDITREEVHQERNRVREYLVENLLRYHEPGSGTPVVGLFAFSQGARVATGLLNYVEERRRHGMDVLTEEFPHFRFAIINCATYPPLFLEDKSSWTQAEHDISSAGKAIVECPSLHLHGSYDPWRPESEGLLEDFYDTRLSTKIEFKGGHAVPIRDEDTKEIVATFYQLASGIETLGLD